MTDVPSTRTHTARWLPLFATACGIALACALGVWQLSRAAEKQARADALAARSGEPPLLVTATPTPVETAALRRVEARGRFDPAHAVFLDNRVYKGVPGYQVLMPLALTGGGDKGLHVLVDRGWIAGTGDRARLPAVRTPGGEVTVTGLAVEPGGRFLELSTKTGEGNVWQNLVLERYRQATGLAIQPFVIRQYNDAEDGLVRDWPAPDFGIDRHYGYVFQWFALGVTLLVFFLVSHVRRSRRRPA
ncbi:MAG: SURF1 family protein [Burkholderiales bacterium]